MSRHRPKRGLTKPSARDRVIADVVPRYYQVYSVLQQRIRAGIWPPERPMPAEEALSTEFGVSRVTVRRALTMLEAEALIVRQQGRGTFATPPPPNGAPMNFGGLLESVADAEHRTTVRILAFDQVALPDDAARWLECPPRSAGLRIERVRSDRDGPFSYTECYLRAPEAALVTREALGNRTVLSMLLTAGILAAAAEQRISATLADVDVARRLKIEVSAPLIKLTRVVRSPEGRPIELIHGLYRPDRYEYRLKLSCDRAGVAPQWTVKD
ncbi:MAG: GntR family transcriptional regulator [Betaproteobacteria bacterium PRO3]|nr:GntR family transcriptional regulator [Betaproteobacteria bacterium PRO3]